MRRLLTSGKATFWPLLLLAVVMLVIAGQALGLELRAGNIIINADGGFAPKALPRTIDAPITFHGGGKLSTVDGGLPPILKTIELEFDRHGHLETECLAVCNRAKLAATTTAQARRNCPGAIVGTGFGRGVVVLPEQAPLPVSSPITLFNGPRVGGNATVLAHAYTTIPAATTYIVPIVIERIHKGIYGYRVQVRLPEIANGYGIPISGKVTVGRKWTYRGIRHSYVNARCETGRLQARGEFSFSDGTFLSGTFLRPCSVRR